MSTSKEERLDRRACENACGSDEDHRDGVEFLGPEISLNGSPIVREDGIDDWSEYWEDENGNRVWKFLPAEAGDEDLPHSSQGGKGSRVKFRSRRGG